MIKNIITLNIVLTLLSSAMIISHQDEIIQQEQSDREIKYSRQAELRDIMEIMEAIGFHNPSAEDVISLYTSLQRCIVEYGDFIPIANEEICLGALETIHPKNSKTCVSKAEKLFSKYFDNRSKKYRSINKKRILKNIAQKEKFLAEIERQKQVEVKKQKELEEILHIMQLNGFHNPSLEDALCFYRSLQHLKMAGKV